MTAGKRNSSQNDNRRIANMHLQLFELDRVALFYKASPPARKVGKSLSQQL